MGKRKILDLSLLLIERIIIHDIPKRRKSEVEIRPDYSEQDTEIPDGTRSMFKDRIISGMSSVKAFNICFDEDNDSPVPALIKDIIDSEDDVFIGHSKSIADRLLESQDGVNTAGILLVIQGRLSENKVCAIMKLERDKGLQLSRNEATRSFDIQEIENLMFTQKTKMYKIALFIDRRVFNIKHDGSLIDFQIDIKAKKEIQTFFMNSFLGCKPFEDPKIATQNFYKFSKVWIETIEDKVTQAKYIQDLNSYIQKPQTTICAKEFAEEYFTDPGEKDGYKKYMKTKSFPYAKAIYKDNSLIEAKIKKITVDFENGVSIIGNKGTLDDNVSFSRLEDGTDKAEIVSKIQKVK